MDIEGGQTFSSKLKSPRTLMFFIFGTITLVVLGITGFFLYSRSPIIIANGAELRIENPNFFAIKINSISLDRVIGRKSQIRYQLGQVDSSFTVDSRGSIKKTLVITNSNDDSQNVNSTEWDTVLKECKPEKHAKKKPHTSAGAEFVIKSQLLFYGENISRQKYVKKIKCPDDGKIELRDIPKYSIVKEKVNPLVTEDKK